MLSSILVIASAVTELVPVFVKLFSLYKEAKLKGWVNDGRDLSKKIMEADTDEKRMELAKLIFKHRAS